MEVKQFYEYSMAKHHLLFLSKNKIVLIDPARNPIQYFDFAKERNANITA